MESEKVGVAFISSTSVVEEPVEHGNGNTESSNSSSFWSKTFGLSTFFFVFLGCPIHLFTFKYSSNAINTPTRVYTTKAWLLLIFSPNFGIFTVIVSFFLLIPTFLLNAYVFYEVLRVVDYLFIEAKYTIDIFWECIYLFRYIPLLVPLDYIWMWGYKIRNMIQDWDHIHWKYQGYGIKSMRVRLRVILMITAVIAVHIIRVFTSLRHELIKESKGSQWAKFEIVFEALLDFCICLLIPLYCTFCYAIKFQLLIVKALVYKWIHERIPPNIHHLNCVKQLYTDVANNILTVNAIFSLYLSITLLMIIVDTLSDSGSLWNAVVKILGGGGFMALIGLLGENEEDGTVDKKLSQSEIREINVDVAGIVITYALIYFMVLQAVATNDAAREINVWLNDFMVGGSGSNVVGILKELGVEMEGENVVTTATTVEDLLDRGTRPIWASTTKLKNGIDDEFIKKFKLLKAYIHARMQTEKPALLSISLVGMLVPALSGRLRQYRLLF